MSLECAALESGVGICGECEFFCDDGISFRTPDRGYSGTCDNSTKSGVLKTYSEIAPVHALVIAGKIDQAKALMANPSSTCYVDLVEVRRQNLHPTFSFIITDEDLAKARAWLEERRNEIHSLGTPTQTGQLSEADR